jgi:hypothetical protein
MEHALEHRIRQRAYEIWHAHGQAHGNADEHWLTAEREVMSAQKPVAPKTSAAPQSQKRTPTASRTGTRRSAKSNKLSAPAQS